MLNITQKGQVANKFPEEIECVEKTARMNLMKDMFHAVAGIFG